MCRLYKLVARWRRGEDRGFAMMSVLLLIIVVGGLTTLAVAASVSNVHGSGLSRAKVQAADAAEAGINEVYSQLQLSSGTNVPCSGTISGTLANGAAYTTDIKYYSVYPPTAASVPIPCSASGLASAPVAAVITSTSTPTQAYQGAGALGKRTMQSLVRISTAPSASNGFDQAVFSDASLQVTNYVNIMGTSGLNAGMYTNGDFTCNSNPSFAGSVIVQGNAYITNSCHIKGDLWAKGNVKGDNNPTVDGMVKSSTGNATLQSSVDIGKGITVAGTCCGGSGGKTTDGKNPGSYWSPIATGVTGMAAPPQVEMPVVTYAPADWTGFVSPVSWASTIQPFLKSATHSACTDLGNWSVKTAIDLPSNPSVISALTDCGSGGIAAQGLTVKLYADTAIFAKAFDFENTMKFVSGDGAKHNLWLIVPWSNGSATCETSGVDRTVGGSTPSSSFTINSGISFDPNVNVMLYTPGSINASNSITMTGQIYACNVSGVLRNQINLTFTSLGVPGVHAGPAATYNVDVVYTREVG